MTPQEAIESLELMSGKKIELTDVIHYKNDSEDHGFRFRDLKNYKNLGNNFHKTIQEAYNNAVLVLESTLPFGIDFNFD